MKYLIHITTFIKNEALDEILKSLVRFGYHGDSAIIITDDSGNRTAEKIYDKYKGTILNLAYATGKKRLGIALNKNRGLKYFHDHPEYEYICMMDDDIEFLKSGLLQRMEQVCREEKIEHVTGYLGDYEDPLSKSGFFTTFPIQAASDNVVWCNGSQGLCLFFTRNIVSQAKWFPKMPYTYGYEHGVFEAHCNRLEGRFPTLHPLFLEAPKYFQTQQIGNNYDVDRELIESKNAVEYKELVGKIVKGTYYPVSSHLNLRDEGVIQNWKA
jgi:glycosyltransferase involved in cell wall biosynthesis